jgi:F-type H+-transporting ATPase subunit alpha
MPTEKQVMILYTAINGYLDDIPVAKIGAFEAGFHQFMGANHPEIGETIAKTKDFSAETEEKLKAAIAEFKKNFSA